MIQFRPYQQDIIDKGCQAIAKKRIIMLAMEVRTGKTLTALGICDKMRFKKVVFITKKKVVVSNTIHNDYSALNPCYTIDITNYEAIEKANLNDVDAVILDEAHCLGAFPKPSLRTKRLKEVIGNKYVILLTGTPTPENWSQIFHQFWISQNSPFHEENFYKWAANYVHITKKFVSHGRQVNDYSNANISLINKKLHGYILSHSQKESGFTTQVEEEILYVKMKPITYQLVNKLERDLVITGNNGGVILADTPVKLMQKTHQLYSGTVKLEDGKGIIIDESKALFVRDRFQNNKIGIFYKFKEELNLLKKVFVNKITENIDEFNNSDKNIALQIVSGREGISLSKADYLVFYNIDFSATSYWQARDRLSTKERVNNKVYWIFSEGGLEDKIYKLVQNKKSFTSKYYEKRNQI